MQRTLILAVALVAVLAALHVANDQLSDSPMVTLRATDADPAELDRLIAVYDGHVTSGRTQPHFEATLGRLLLRRASAGSGIDDYERAAAHLHAAFAAAGQDVVGLDLARAQIALHRFEAAIHTLSAVSATEDPIGHALVAFDAHVGIGALDTAAVSLSQLERRFPGEPAVLTRQAELSFLRGDGATAVELASRAAQIAADAELTDREQSFQDLAAARYLLLAGDTADALALSTAASDRTPDHPGAWLLRARATAATGQIVDAVEAAERSVALAPTPASLSFLADLYLATGDEPAAELQLATIEAIAELGQGVFRRDVALALAEHGRSLGVALEAARAELAVRPDSTSHHVMATALHALGEIDAAARHAAEALDLPDPDVWYRAGMIAAEAGDRDAALERLGHALELSPNFHPSRAETARSLVEELGA